MKAESQCFCNDSAQQSSREDVFKMIYHRNSEGMSTACNNNHPLQEKESFHRNERIPQNTLSSLSASSLSTMTCSAGRRRKARKHKRSSCHYFSCIPMLVLVIVAFGRSCAHAHEHGNESLSKIIPPCDVPESSIEHFQLMLSSILVDHYDGNNISKSLEGLGRTGIVSVSQVTSQKRERRDLNDGEDAEEGDEGRDEDADEGRDEEDDAVVEDDDAGAVADDYAVGDDYAADDDGEAAADDDDNAVNDNYLDDDVFISENNKCYQYLMSFLEGTTDAKDHCEGIMNAYVGADCGYASGKNGLTKTADDDHDDYFATDVFQQHFACCQSLKSHYDEYCSENDLITNQHLLLIAIVLLLCEMAKSLIKRHKVHFLPEVGGCIIVGILFGLITKLTSTVSVDDFAFDDDIFLCVLLPPIIFEAALSVSKKEFRRRRMAILMFAVIGTIISTFMTGYMVHYASKFISGGSTPHLPMLDSFVFGALISSIDPVAILSVLSSLNLTEKDTIYIIVFGESLLNDGIAITLFKALINRYSAGTDYKISTDDILGLIADFLIVFFGSIIVGLICGVFCLLWFWLLRKKLASSMEVVCFFLWAGIPYYICDGIGFSGIVSIVTMGFFMDIYIAAPRTDDTPHDPDAISVDYSHTQMSEAQRSQSVLSDPHSTFAPSTPHYNHYVDMEGPGLHVNTACGPPGVRGQGQSDLMSSANGARPHFFSLRSTLRSREKSMHNLKNIKEIFLREERFRMSEKADKHVRFVAHLLSQLCENSIFVYLGLFLFSKNYNWDMMLITVSIISTILSRGIMVIVICGLVWHINVCRQGTGCCGKPKPVLDRRTSTAASVNSNYTCDDAETTYTQQQLRFSRTAIALLDPKVQVVLVLSGLRGAVSLALVENVPIYNGLTGDGSLYKPEMKAMTSAAIIFTVFVFGGSAYYILRKLNIKDNEAKIMNGSIGPNGNFGQNGFAKHEQPLMIITPKPTIVEEANTPITTNNFQTMLNSLGKPPPSVPVHSLAEPPIQQLELAAPPSLLNAKIPPGRTTSSIS